VDGLYEWFLNSSWSLADLQEAAEIVVDNQDIWITAD